MAKSAVMTVTDQSFTAKLARDHKRATDYRRKWRYGETTSRSSGDKIKPARHSPFGHDTWDSEAPRQSSNPSKWDFEDQMVKGRLNGYTPTWSGAESVDNFMAENEGCDAGTPAYFYSYDHRTSPSHHGEHVLGAAIDQAVARFENKVTETLVKNEYDVVNEAASDAGDEHAHEQDEDFELV